MLTTRFLLDPSASVLKKLRDHFPKSLFFRQLNTTVKMTTNQDSLSQVKPMVGVVQMTSTPDKEANFAQATALVQRAKNRGAQMVFLPECFDIVGESREQAVSEAEPLDGDIISRYKAMAKRLRLWLSLGGFHEKKNPADKQVHNTHIVIDETGQIKGTYSKTHLFDVDIKGGVRLKETDFTVPGSSLGPPVDTPVGKVGMSICYDLRFPELSIVLAQQGAEILTFPSAFTVTTGMAHWEVLLRSRAIENQCYVIAAAQTGKHHAKRSSYGHSMIVDPWGCVAAECHDKVDVCVAEIDLEYLHRRRLEMPVWSHRRSDLYGHLSAQVHDAIDNVASYQFGQYSVKSSQVFYKSALSIAFVNRKPVLPGHVLVSPIRPAERFADLTQAEVSDLFSVVQKVSGVIEKHYNSTSLTVAIQDGPEAGQTVTHAHVHVLPRKKGDFEENDDIYDKLEKHDKEVTASQWRSDEDMSQEAVTLRPLFS